MASILLVEDDAMLGRGLKDVLTRSGYIVEWFTTVADAKLAVKGMSFDAVLLDWNLPDGSGLDVLHFLRDLNLSLPVMLLTARDQIPDKILALDQGADDYLVKPFEVGELEARLRAIMRRPKGQVHSVWSCGDVQLDPVSHEVLYQGKGVELSPKEYALLKLFFEHRGQVLSKSRLEESLYGWNEDVESNAVEVHVHHLRKKLGADLIKTQRGFGYIMDKS